MLAETGAAKPAPAGTAETAAAAAASAGALTAKMTRSWEPSVAGSSVQRGLTTVASPSLPMRRRPRSRIAARCGPRATSATSAPEVARRAPSSPPIAPAPKMQILASGIRGSEIGAAQRLDHGLRHGARRGRAAEIGGQHFSRCGNALDGAHEPRRALGLAEVIQHERAGPEARDRVGDALAGDVEG